MSDTVSDLASRAQAREEVVRDDLVDLVADNLPGWVYRATDRDDWIEVADAILDPEVFARLAGLLGYVKADGGHWLVRRDGITYPNVFVDEAAARLWARDFTDRGAGCVFVRRCTADVEVVTNADPR